MMATNVVLFDQGQIGHHLYIRKIIAQHFHPQGYSYRFGIADVESNALAVLRELYDHEPFTHCHLMTLERCITDFADTENVQWFVKNGISFSANMYDFAYLSPYIMLRRALWNRLHPQDLPPSTALGDAPVQKFLGNRPLALMNLYRDLLVRGVIRKIGFPDERIESWWFYPYYRKQLMLLPDPAAFRNSPEDCVRAKSDLGWDDGIPTFLMFGLMDRRKGLNLLIRALSHEFASFYHVPLRVVIAGLQMETRENPRLSPNVILEELNEQIPDDLARRLFGAADCILLPFIGSSEYSSGTFSLACASGKYVIAPDRGILGWRIRHFGNGYLFSPDNPGSLAHAIRTFLKMRHELPTPCPGSLRYGDTCTPERYTALLDSMIRESFQTV